MHVVRQARRWPSSRLRLRCVRRQQRRRPVRLFLFEQKKKVCTKKRSREPWVGPAGRPAQAVQKAESGLSKYPISTGFYKVSRHVATPCEECILAWLLRIVYCISCVRQARPGGPLGTCQNSGNPLCFQHGRLLLQSHGFQKKSRFLGILQKQWEIKQTQHFRGSERLRLTTRAPWRSCAEGRVPMREC